MIQKILNTQSQRYEVLEEIHPTEKNTYIDTGVYSSSNISIEIKYSLRNYIQYGRLFSTDNMGWDLPYNIGIYYENNYLKYKWLNDRTWYSSSLSRYDTNVHIIKITDTEFLLDGTLENSRSGSNLQPSTTQIRLLSSSALDQGYFDIYYVKIWEGNTLVRDYVPAKRLLDNIIGLYDYVNNTFSKSNGDKEFSGTSKSTPEYIDVHTGHVVYVNDIIINNTHINRIYNKGEIYWGGDAESTPPTPTHLLHGTTTLTGSGTFNIGINNTSYNSQKNVPVQYDNGEFWLDELPSSIGTITNLVAMFFDLSHVTSIDEFNLDTSQCRNWCTAFGGAGITSFGNISPDLSSCTNLHDGFHKFQGETLDLSRFHVPSTVTDVNGLFYNSPNLKHIDVSNWQLGSLTPRDFWYNMTKNQIVDVTMNNASEGTFNTFKYALQHNYPLQTTAKIYRDGTTYVCNGGVWVIE